MQKSDPGKIRILYAVSEAVPLVKTGGLADVIGSLPGAMDRKKFDCRVILPLYSTIRQAFREQLDYQGNFRVPFGDTDKYAGIFCLQIDGIQYELIDNEEFFGGPLPYEGGLPDIKKFIFFDRAVLELIRFTGWRPDVIHCHDWQTGLLPPLLDQIQENCSFFSGIRTVFTIHNLKFQGIWNLSEVRYLSGLSDRYFTMRGLEYYGNANMMKGGILWSHAVTTVSESYAEEILTPEYGEGLDGLLREQSYKLTGILNGIDTSYYDPASDGLIRVHYSVENASEAKRENKLLLQNKLGLEEDPDVFMAGIVTRLTDQKGMDLLSGVLDTLVSEGIQLVLVGTGEAGYERRFLEAKQKYPGRVAAEMRFSEHVAHKTYAAADAYLMPSRFEPCGLSQLIALRYGTLPVVRETGGLKDTVIPYNKYTGEGTGFSFAGYSREEFLDAVLRAKDTFVNSPDAWKKLMKQAMQADFSWKASAQRYCELYVKLSETGK